MGYFPNSDAGMAYEAEWCERCVHSGPKGKPCAVWGAHLLHSYTAKGDTEEVLDLLIPKASSGIGNKKCEMFITVEDVKRKRKERAQTSLPLALPVPAAPAVGKVEELDATNYLNSGDVTVKLTCSLEESRDWAALFGEQIEARPKPPGAG